MPLQVNNFMMVTFNNISTMIILTSEVDATLAPPDEIICDDDD
jgi:hypothetical protein